MYLLIRLFTTTVNFYLLEIKYKQQQRRNLKLLLLLLLLSRLLNKILCKIVYLTYKHHTAIITYTQRNRYETEIIFIDHLF